MDTKLRDVLAFLVSNYPHPTDLSKARAIKLVYLADWAASLRDGKPITNVDWYFNHYGPYVRSIEDDVRSSTEFSWESGMNAYGSPKETLVWNVESQPDWPTLDQRDQAVLKDVIRKTQNLNFTEFLSVVYDTYPVKNSMRYDPIRLGNWADKYHASRPR